MNNIQLVSVCVPVFNCKLFIEKTLQSVLSQSFSDFQLIIQDNCSTDGTTEIVQAFVERANDPRIVFYLNEAPVSLKENWNSIIRRAQGKYVKLLCSDDLIDSDCLASQVKILEDPKNTHVILTCSQRRIIDADDAILFQKWNVCNSQGRMTRGLVLQMCVRHCTNIFGEPCAVLFRTHAFSKTSGFQHQSSYVIDVDFWLRLLEFGDAYFDNRILCSFRIYKTSGTGAAGLKQVSQTLNFFEEIYLQHSDSIGRLNFWCGRLIGGILGILRVILIFFLK